MYCVVTKCLNTCTPIYLSMITIKALASLPKILSAIFFGFLAIFSLRVIWPIVDMIFGLWTTNNIMKVAATLVFWLVTVFVLYFMVWLKFFEKPDTEAQ